MTFGASISCSIFDLIDRLAMNEEDKNTLFGHKLFRVELLLDGAIRNDLINGKHRLSGNSVAAVMKH